MAWTLRASDDFNRANELPIGAPWMAAGFGANVGNLQSNTWSNRLGTSSVAMHSQTVLNNQKVKVTFKFTNNTGTGHLWIGLRNADNHSSYVHWTSYQNNFYIETQAGQIGLGVAYTAAQNDIIEFEITGTTVTTTINSVVKDTRDVPSAPASGRAYIGWDGAANFSCWDDFFLYDAPTRTRYPFPSFKP